MINDKLKSYAAATKDFKLAPEHRQHKGLNNRAEKRASTELTTRSTNEVLQVGQVQRFLSIHDPIANLFHGTVNLTVPHRDAHRGMEVVEHVLALK